MNNKLLNLVIILSLFSTLNFAQGAFLEKDQYGADFSVFYSQSANPLANILGATDNKSTISAYGISASISILGFIDFGVGVGKFEERFFSATVINPKITYHFLKQSQHVPLSMSVFFGYEEWLLSKDAPDAITSFYNFGTELALNFQVSPTVFLRPDIGIAYRTGKKESEEHLFITLNRNRINETDLKLGLTCYFNSNEYTIIRFRAGLHLKNNSDDLIFGDDHFGFDFNAGVIFKF